ncbi:hypothetical protein [Paracoccus gahaiensis]|uniref:hypothetical protein n=1 Tax=Paracoccus gahaiensis TaxID=1706839 RepID=UPI00145DFCD4|nr:hypothetical protein [Paracoccus gahaiensis]
MFPTDSTPRYPARTDTPDLLFAPAVDKAIAGVEGQIRAALKSSVQARGARFRSPPMTRAPEEVVHVEIRSDPDAARPASGARSGRR